MPSDAAMRAAKAIMSLPSQALGMSREAAFDYMATQYANIIDREFSRGLLIVTPNDPAKAPAAALLEKVLNHTIKDALTAFASIASPSTNSDPSP